MKSSRTNRIRTVSLGGILAALIVLLLIGVSWSPTADLALYALAGCCVAIAVIETGRKGAVLVWLAAGAIAVVYPGIAQAGPFLAAFGSYPLIRSWIDGRLPRRAAVVLRVAVAALQAIVSTMLLAGKALTDLAVRYGFWFWPIFAVAIVLGAWIFDYALTLLITLYCRRIRK